MSEFADAVLAWARWHGRHGLPWQNPATPYRVWVSEIMLQQTQVATVIPYFERFTAQFPTIGALAGAPVDDVLGLWSGLGYYARARNLHTAAVIVARDCNGELPDDLPALQSLPGIGRSTAGAILSLSANQPHAILDGNVKRVLARAFAVDGWPGQSAVNRRLWAIAEQELPRAEPGPYNQAMMDLGAMLCTRSSPDCENCPVSALCIARQQSAQTRYPGRKPKRTQPVRSAVMLMLKSEYEGLLLERRANNGRWGGLWSFPEFTDADEALAWVSRIGTTVEETRALAPFRHTFTHFHFDIEPLLVETGAIPPAIMEDGTRVWYNGGPLPGGTPKPVTDLLKHLEDR